MSTRPRTVLLMAACIVFNFFLGLAAIGWAVPTIVLAQPDLEIAIILGDVEDDFIAMGRTCNVTWINHCWHTTSDDQDPSVPASSRKSGGQPTCWQAYTARFTTSDTDDTFSAWPEFKADGQRDCGSGCHSYDARRTPSGDSVSGSLQECWRARGHSIDRRYLCNNNPCYKLSDPAIISHSARDAAQRAIGLDSGLFAVALLACCTCSCLTSRLLRTEVAGKGVPTVTVVTQADRVTSGTRNDEQKEVDRV